MPPRNGHPPLGGGSRVIRNRPTRTARGGPVVRNLREAARSPTAEIIDTATGKPHGAAILEALAALAVGTPEQIEKTFGAPLRMRARDRHAALQTLEQRRFGRVPSVDDQTPDVRPVTIVNVFATSEEYAFVTQARPKLVGTTRAPQLETGDEQP